MEIVRRFERLVTESWPRSPLVCRLATALGMSQRTLEGLFQDHMGLSPKRYAMVLQLNAAHRQLLRSSPDNATVAGVARACGVRHLGRFASAYRQQFGEAPSDTLRHRRPAGKGERAPPISAPASALPAHDP